MTLQRSSTREIAARSLAGAWQRACQTARRRWDRLAAALFGLGYFLALTDVRVLDPRHIEVVAAGDASYHALARDFAQWDGWHWPITRIDNYLWPVGTSAVFTDANPWIVVATKLLLPASSPPLQFVGSWLALCFLLQGWFGARIAALFTDDRASRALTGALFATAPVLVHRLGHDSLCAHWILLALVELALRVETTCRAKVWAVLEIGAVLALAAGLHPTLFAMSIPLALVGAWWHSRPHSAATSAALAATSAAPALVWVVFGTLGSGIQRETHGFGHFSANLLTLVDPYDVSRSALLPPLPHGQGQYEGFGYLGVGALLLAVLGAVVAWRHPRVPVRDGETALHERSQRRRWYGLAVATGLCAVFSLSSRVMAGDHLIVDLSPLYRPFRAVTDGFRSSGRFVWPLHYFVVSLAVMGALRLRVRHARAALAVALLLQLVDARRVDGRGAFTLDATPEAPSALWGLARGDYAHLVMDPPQVETNVALCPEDHHAPGSFVKFAQVARREHLTFNSGQAARVNETAVARYCVDLARARTEGRFDPLSLYVRDVDDPPAAGATGLMCRLLDGVHVCVAADRSTPFARVLASPRGPEVRLDEDPRVVFESGFAAPEGEGARRWRSASVRATLLLRRPGDGPAILGFVARLTAGVPAGVAPRLRVSIDGRDQDGTVLVNGTAVGTYAVSAPSELTRVTFEVEPWRDSRATLPAVGAWQLVRLEWFAAR